MRAFLLIIVSYIHCLSSGICENAKSISICAGRTDEIECAGPSLLVHPTVTVPAVGFPMR
jgi:hypothetical protein